MDSRDYDIGRIKRLIETLRSATLAVQIVPFVFAALYIIDFIAYSAMSEAMQQACDTLFYVSPIIVFSHLIYSRILHLCKWHRLACILPLFPLSVSLFDYYILSLSAIETYITNGLTLSMSALLLVAAYKVFLSPKHA